MSEEKSTKKEKLSKKRAKKEQSSSTPLESLPRLPSMEALLASLGGMIQGKRSLLDQAQDLIYDAWEAPTRQRAVALAQKALMLSQDCADAYVLLAERTAESVEEAIELYRKGVEAGERALGKRAFKKAVGHFWGLLETRPYMRARAGLAQCLWEAGRREEAVENYWDMLRLNPNDNQGIRDLLMPRLIELGRDEEAEKLFELYKGDPMAVWKYSRALLDFRKSGDSSAALKSLQAALNENKYVPSYLLNRKKMPRYLPDLYGFGDENEAVLYAYGNKAAWRSTPGALEWLAAKVKG